MTGHTLRLLDSIQHACEQYLAGGTAIKDLQAAVEPVVAALEDGDERLESTLRRFLAQLEYTRFMFETSEQFGEVEREISLLLGGILSYKGRHAAHRTAE